MAYDKLSCKEILEKLSEYIDEELDPSMCDEIDEHMGDCPPCVAFMNTLKKTVKLYNTSGDEVDIPSPVRTKLHDFLRRRCNEEKE
ncbi:MAG: hypothetical protein C0608_05680 [Deltaproteobacteria bacterium]|nr:MAG: hypothetical protein C0608_05680 [Deltaproteobacteria bacterium]